jgi:hypothetical protein
MRALSLDAGALGEQRPPAPGDARLLVRGARVPRDGGPAASLLLRADVEAVPDVV